MLYSEKVMDHFTHPRNLGKMDDADGVGEVGNAKCGDIMKIYIKVENDVITDVKFNTFGCGSAIASSSMATEMIKGKPLCSRFPKPWSCPTRLWWRPWTGCLPISSTAPSWLKRPSGLLSRTTTTATASPTTRRSLPKTAPLVTKVHVTAAKGA